jgi:hypothetical protein
VQLDSSESKETEEMIVLNHLWDRKVIEVTRVYLENQDFQEKREWVEPLDFQDNVEKRVLRDLMECLDLRDYLVLLDLSGHQVLQDSRDQREFPDLKENLALLVNKQQII